MKKVVLTIILFFIFLISPLAHKANVTGYKDKNSDKISNCNNKYYAFHKESNIYHYHEVKWENDKWIVINSDKTFQDNPCGYNNEKIEVKFSSCVDGDTAKFIYNDEIITVRFLAVDTPETVHPTKEVMAYGKEASDFTCNKLKGAKNIYLEYDIASDKFDKYNRHLAWVFVDNELLQKSLISKGYGKIEYIYGSYRYLNELYELESVAKKNNIGLWSLEENKEDSVSSYVYFGIIVLAIIYSVYETQINKKKVKSVNI